jgi:DNA-binding NarL/FixJ family response regulator
MTPIRVAVVDDHAVVLHGLRLALEPEQDLQVVGEARTGVDAVRMVTETRPDVVLLDVRLGDSYGPDVCRQILATAPNTAVVMLTSYPQDSLVLQSLMAGAKGYVIKDVELAELKRTIRSVHQGNAVLDPKVAGHVISTAADRTARGPADGPARPTARLSAADARIIGLLSDGLTNKEIAVRVGLSPHTVKDHIDRISGALGVRSRVKVVVEALRRGLI